MNLFLNFNTDHCLNFQVQFDEWQDTKYCTVIISDDSIFEGPEDFYVELQEPTFALLGKNAKATVAIYDLEDGMFIILSAT